MINAGQRADSVLDRYGVILTHLGVDVKYHRIRDIFQLIPEFAKAAAQDASHKLAHERCLTVTALTGNHV